MAFLLLSYFLLLSPTHGEMEHSQNLSESCNISFYSLWLPQCVILELPKILLHQTGEEGLYQKTKER